MTIYKTKFVILGLLATKPMSGYDIKKFISVSIGHFWSESPGQIYPALHQLLEEKLIMQDIKQSKSKRARDQYSITDAGRSCLLDWLSETSNKKIIRRDEELLRLFFGENVSFDLSLGLLRQRMDRVQKTVLRFYELQRYLEEISSPQNLYWRLCLKNGIAQAEAEVRWCQEAIITIQEGNKND